MAIRKPIFTRPHSLGTIATGNEAAGFPAANLNRHKAVGLTWKSAGNGNLWVRGDFGSARPVDFCSVVSANALPGTQIRLRLGDTQGEVDGTADYDSTALPFISPSITREDGLYHSHLELPSVQTKRWWRIDITGHTGDFQASNLVLGQKVEPSGFYNFEWEFGAEDMGGLEIGRWGVFDEEDGVIMRTLQFTLGWQSEAEFEAHFRPMMERLGRRGIVHLVFDPEATAYRQAKTYMGVFSKVPFARSQRKPQTYSQDFQILSYI